ncbi:MAG: glycosyl hydrolase [Chloroflexi bacterium]|nr:glycosyl hydrolase [Chloroflexota bacterium]
MSIPESWLHPPRAFSVMPFWFWNDTLDEREIVRQIREMEAHGVYGFVIHPRVGLPRDLSWMSERLLSFYRVAIEEAQRRDMSVILYDEGMYPSGASSGQVVAANPAFQCRGLAKLDLSDGGEPALSADANLVAVVRRKNGTRIAVIDRPVDSVIRGLHYVGEGPVEDEPLAADILNPAAVAEFIRLVYDRFAAHFGPYFGATIPAIFTDEPSPLGRCRERAVVPGTAGILPEVNRILGYDFTPHLPALWYDDEPDAPRFRMDYELAIAARLEETYYAQLSAWCEAHGVALTGHPAKGSDIGSLRHFHVPGQDLVWRWVLPDHPSALEGSEATQAKCSASAMLHGGRRRNANECCGAYGHQLTWDEMTWLAHWCFIRGVNWLFPHAFYYSVRGPRWDERPPDVGPHAAWWDRYRQYADACHRLSWLNTDCQHVCHIAILGQSTVLPWRSAKICLEHQRDFNYLEERHLWEDARVDEDGIHLRGMCYRALIVEGAADRRAQPALAALQQAGRFIRFSDEVAEDELIARLDERVPQDLCISPAAPGLRVRHIVKDGCHGFMLFNETHPAIEIQVGLPVTGPALVFDPWTAGARVLPADHRLWLPGHSFCVIAASDEPVGDAR